MSSAELAAKFEKLLGRPCRTRNVQYLRKRLAWEIQARIEGGLSEKAVARIDALGSQAGTGWKEGLTRPTGKATASAESPDPRDARIPPAGTVDSRTYGAAQHLVTVLVDGFEYRGEKYRSLSKIARLVTGTAWNGYHFFFGRAGGTRERPGTVSP